MTIGGFAFERVFSLPALGGLQSLRLHLLADPKMAIEEALTILRAGDLDVQGLDLDASVALLSLVPSEVPNDGPGFYRGCIKYVLLAYQPIWARTMIQGRSRFYAALERDEQSIFRQAGIMDEPPEDDFVEWWDALAGEMRLVTDLERLLRGRAAERLTIAHELARMKEEGITEEPRWIGLDDNTKGYDVLSFELDGNKLVNKLIEVKSTIASPLRFRVTRNEWEQAEKFGAAYVFHVWDLARDPAILYVRTVDQVRPHIPVDSEKGKWKDAEIPVGI